MATKLTKPVEREITLSDVYGHKGPVIVTLTATGLEFRGKGKQRKVSMPFSAMKPNLPANAPASFMSNAFGWLIEGAKNEPTDDMATNMG